MKQNAHKQGKRRFCFLRTPVGGRNRIIRRTNPEVAPCAETEFDDDWRHDVELDSPTDEWAQQLIDSGGVR